MVIGSKYLETLMGIMDGILPGEWKEIPSPQRPYSCYVCLQPIDDKPVPFYEMQIPDGTRQFYFHQNETPAANKLN
ncbi:MAG: hypothetical protein AABX51_05370 [Nanoarchaeota archaeon]